MTLIATVQRSGINTKRITVGPAELAGPCSRRGQQCRIGYAEKVGITGAVDRYNITDGSGANEGTYTIKVEPFATGGMPATISGVGKIALFQQVGGVADPAAAITCVAFHAPPRSDQSVTLGPVSVATGDNLWVVVERRGKSDIRYQIHLEQVLDAITISAQPPNRTVAAPDGTTFTVSASTNDGGTLSYQWTVSTDGGTTYGNVTNGGVYSGATGATLTISDSTGLDTYLYKVKVNSSGGSPQVTSNAGRLVAEAITIGVQPAGASVTAPAAASFSVVATTNDGGDLSYQWKVSADGGSTYSDVTDGGVFSGATTSNLAISDSTGLDGRKYRVVISSDGGSHAVTSTAATLTVA